MTTYTLKAHLTCSKAVWDSRIQGLHNSLLNGQGHIVRVGRQPILWVQPGGSGPGKPGKRHLQDDAMFDGGLLSNGPE